MARPAFHESVTGEEGEQLVDTLHHLPIPLVVRATGASDPLGHHPGAVVDIHVLPQLPDPMLERAGVTLADAYLGALGHERQRSDDLAADLIVQLQIRRADDDDRRVLLLAHSPPPR